LTNEILVTKFRVNYVKFTSTKRNTTRETPHLCHMIVSRVPSSRDLRRPERCQTSKTKHVSAVALAAVIVRK
jgi:hypothetical protein